ncbi:type I restriction enzyme HsdR N-terminal domain-containing protein [Clostridium tyrobutyricum]|uniref:type I restriction endonuclease n=1 Tax=Clostridium tyrobutyricum TaxID=1519 RepID=UPI001C38D62C|nr:type I restriction endonuclease [Clostridium tyrobutyricum]MBV4445687.1 type I restriction enzyme HsdR N-terminal domain-containing protein [Clostridium tyrobutyricum]
MDIKEKIQALSDRAETLVDQIKTEEATKQSLILPFFQMLGYDVFNPLEFCPEFDADYGVKKGEKVDYAILINGAPTILIEAKECNDNLNKHGSQLFRYYTTSSAKFGILTNGIKYRFYTDLDEPNKMDEKPFFEINLFDLKDSSIEYLEGFSKDELDVDAIINSASDLKYTSLIKDFLKRQMEKPSEDFANYILGEIYEGRRTSSLIEKFIPIVKKSLNQFINETMSNKFRETLKGSDSEDENKSKEEAAATVPEDKHKILTTVEELEAYAIIKSIFRNTIDLSHITYKDTESYFGILFDNNTRKWICRLSLNVKKVLTLPNEDKTHTKYELESLNDLYSYSDKLIEVLNRYIN